MRLAGIEKGGFYPYPPHKAEATASWFIPFPSGTYGRLLDLSHDQLALGGRFMIKNYAYSHHIWPSFFTALCLACFFSTSPQFWMGLENDYDLDLAADALANRLDVEVRLMAVSG